MFDWLVNSLIGLNCDIFNYSSSINVCIHAFNKQKCLWTHFSILFAYALKITIYECGKMIWAHGCDSLDWRDFNTAEREQRVRLPDLKISSYDANALASTLCLLFETEDEAQLLHTERTISRTAEPGELRWDETLLVCDTWLVTVCTIKVYEPLLK